MSDNDEALAFAPMTEATLPGVLSVLVEFLVADPHYLASREAYGGGDTVATGQAAAAALRMFLARPELGFVFVAARGARVVACCVVCYAISTSRGGLVAKLDDVSVAPGDTGRGIGGAMIEALKTTLRRRGVTRIDCGCHRDNDGAWRFYRRHGFQPLYEERIACLLQEV